MDAWLQGAEKAFESSQDAGAMPTAERLLALATAQAQISIAHSLARLCDLIVVADEDGATDGQG